MRLRFILSETWSSLKRNVPMLLSVMLVTFISFLFIGASVLTQAQITKAKGDWYSKVEVVVWMCPDGTSQSVNCTAGTAATQTQINDLQKTIRNELADDVSQITFVSKEDSTTTLSSNNIRTVNIRGVRSLPTICRIHCG